VVWGGAGYDGAGGGAMQRLLFVCTGNLCRSPMAAAIADQLALAMAREVEIRSAGTRARAGDPAHPQVVAVCRELGIDLTAHRATPLDEALVRWADRVFVMEPEHATAARTLAPDLPEASVVHLAGLVGKAVIEDPIGAWFRSTYRRTRDELASAVRRALTS
jgi:protein-tyrosine-phosphatase